MNLIPYWIMATKLQNYDIPRKGKSEKVKIENLL